MKYIKLFENINFDNIDYEEYDNPYNHFIGKKLPDNEYKTIYYDGNKWVKSSEKLVDQVFYKIEKVSDIINTKNGERVFKSTVYDDKYAFITPKDLYNSCIEWTILTDDIIKKMNKITENIDFDDIVEEEFDNEVRFNIGDNPFTNGESHSIYFWDHVNSKWDDVRISYFSSKESILDIKKISEIDYYYEGKRKIEMFNEPTLLNGEDKYMMFLSSRWCWIVIPDKYIDNGLNENIDFDDIDEEEIDLPKEYTVNNKLVNKIYSYIKKNYKVEDLRFYDDFYPSIVIDEKPFQLSGPLHKKRYITDKLSLELYDIFGEENKPSIRKAIKIFIDSYK